MSVFGTMSQKRVLVCIVQLICHSERSFSCDSKTRMTLRHVYKSDFLTHHPLLLFLGPSRSTFQVSDLQTSSYRLWPRIPTWYLNSEDNDLDDTKWPRFIGTIEYLYKNDPVIENHARYIEQQHNNLSFRACT